ncbi:hypothetical protein [Corynebacterium caspium]|uniref:hypothetical protein n=1 Tax=Corynebacterium caspium TaxID=234828 RepID=UPI00037E8061|nr:hypothetical protein [Corynebacterium caspium]WKD58595.1 hypothetical protein CCASP_00840 [Corynebacterium caspium DSM 44850]
MTTPKRNIAIFKYLELFFWLFVVVFVAKSCYEDRDIPVQSLPATGCETELIKEWGHWMPGEQDWVWLRCGDIEGAKYARVQMECNFYPDASTSWITSNNYELSTGCLFGHGEVVVQYVEELPS